MSPLYEYKCSNCEKMIEKQMSVQEYEQAIEICTFCNSKMDKVISKSNFVLKGKGWHSVDYKEEL